MNIIDTLFGDNEIANSLGFRKKDDSQLKNIKLFIEKKLTYYSDLYARIKKNEYIFLSYNYNINDLSGQYQNIIAACAVNDRRENIGTGVEFKPIEEFNAEALEYRSKLLFHIVKNIWEVD